MKKFIYTAHLWLGLFVSIPVLAWALSGLMYAIPNTVEGGTIEKIDSARVKISPSEAMQKANALAGKELPTTALTLLMKDGKPQYQSIGGLGADSIFIDAETGEARMSCAAELENALFPRSAFLLFCGQLAGDASDNFFTAGESVRADGNLFELRLLAEKI